MSIPEGFIPLEENQSSFPSDSITENLSIESSPSNSQIPQGFIPLDEQSSPSKSKNVADSLKFFGYKPEEETIQKIRQPAGVGVKGLTKGLLGLPGELIELGETIFGNIPKGGNKLLPNTEDVGKFFEKRAKEGFTPENTFEQWLDRGAEFLGGSLSLGGLSKATNLKRAIGKNLLGSFVPAGVSVLAEEADLPPWMQAAATIGTGILTHGLANRSLKQLNKEWHKQAREMASGTMLDVTPAISRLKNLKETISGRIKSDSARQFLDKHIDSVLDKIDRGLISANQWMDVNTSLNDVALEAKDLPGAKRLFGSIKSAVQSLGKQFERNNKQAYKMYRNANSLTKGINESRFIERFIQNNPILSTLGGTGSLFGSILKLGLGSTVGKGIGGGVLAKGFELAAALSRNKGLRKAYWETIKRASKEEARGTYQSLKKFNDEAKKAGIKKD
jgi:hypothetical protein